ncbi:MAG: OsmC family protein [Bacillota bacterium]
MPDITFSATGTSERATLLRVKPRTFTIMVDEPESLGGLDEAPNPVEYLLAALAGCLNVVGHVVAREMHLELKGLTMEVEGNLNPERFLGKSMAERAGYKQIRVILHPDMQADEATKKKWLETIEQRCPVSDNIMNPTPVSITVV